MKEEQTIYTLKLHEHIVTSDSLIITRVPGGWIYEYSIVDSLVFVPFSGEFMGGKVDITFTQEPVYEYQWLVDHGDDKLIITKWHRTEEEVLSTFRKFSHYDLVIVERLDKYKREVKG